MKTLRYLSGSLDKRLNQFVLCMVSVSLLQSLFLVDNSRHVGHTNRESTSTSAFLVNADTKESIPGQSNSTRDQIIPDTTKILDELIPCNEEDTASEDLFSAPCMCYVGPGYYTFSVLMHGRNEALGIPKKHEIAIQAGEINQPGHQKSEITRRITEPVTGDQVFNADTTLPDTIKNYPVLVI